jgi:hypothetical protein
MSPLSKGPGSIRKNVTELMGRVQSPARKKAILTIDHKNNMTRSQAQFAQAKAIAISQSRKK